jgi:AcrR family transcriptional regulator
MSRWKPDARGRIAQAAMDLYAHQGFDRTTVAEIAEKAGVTERTFFRHFSDKREVLFGGSDRLLELMVKAVADAPRSAVPIEAVAAALEASTTVLTNREYSRRRQKIIAANLDLQERELIKMATLASAMSRALRRRGVPESTASLTAETGIAVFRVAFQHWVSGTNRRELPDLIHDSLGELKIVVGSPKR